MLVWTAKTELFENADVNNHVTLSQFIVALKLAGALRVYYLNLCTSQIEASTSPPPGHTPGI